MTYTFERRYIHVVKVSFSLYIRKKKFTILKIRQVSHHSSLKHKKYDVIDDLVFQNLLEHDINKEGNNTLLS